MTTKATSLLFCSYCDKDIVLVVGVDPRPWHGHKEGCLIHAYTMCGFYPYQIHEIRSAVTALINSRALNHMSDKSLAGSTSRSRFRRWGGRSQ